MQYSSVLTLVALSVDRCLATYPRLAHLRRIAVGVGVCAAVWAASLLGAGTPYAAFSGVVAAGRRRRSCRVRWPWSGRVAAQRAWTYGHLLVGVVVPLALIAAANALLVRRLRSLAGYSTSLRRTPAAADAAAADRRRSTHQNAADESWSARRQRASHSMARLVLAIVVIFVVCQLPYHIIEVLRVVSSCCMPTFALIIVSIPSPPHSFIPGLKPSCSANHSHRSLPFLLRD